MSNITNLPLYNLHIKYGSALHVSFPYIRIFKSDIQATVNTTSTMTITIRMITLIVIIVIVM